MRTFAIAALLLFLIASPCKALGPWIIVEGGCSTYSMSDMNDYFQYLNELAGQDFLDEVKGGPAFGVAFGYIFSPSFACGLMYE